MEVYQMLLAACIGCYLLGFATGYLAKPDRKEIMPDGEYVSDESLTHILRVEANKGRL